MCLLGNVRMHSVNKKLSIVFTQSIFNLVYYFYLRAQKEVQGVEEKALQ